MCLEKMENTFDSLETAFEQQDSLNNSLCVSQFASEQSSTKEGRKYFESDGEIGNRKGDTFIALTNFSIRCTGYVARDANATSADGLGHCSKRIRLLCTKRQQQRRSGETVSAINCC